MLASLILCGLGAQGLFAQVIPHPTGNNGYEEYLRAADLAAAPEFGQYLLWRGVLWSADEHDPAKLPPGVTLDDDDLALTQKFVIRFGKCLDLVRAGNQKPVVDPHTNPKLGASTAELAAFKGLEKLEGVAAHVAFAGGETGLAVGRVLDGLTLADNIGSQTTVSALVAIACRAIALSELNLQWAQLNLADAQQLVAALKPRLERPCALIASLPIERQSVHDRVGQLFSQPKDAASQYPEGSDVRGLIESIASMPADTAAALRAATLAKVDAYFDHLDAVLGGPEANWLRNRDLDSSPEVTQGPESRLADASAPYGANVVAEIRGRTQLRLAYLSAKATEFYWQNGKLPTRLEEFATPKERIDPSSGAQFKYLREGAWFRIIRDTSDAVGPMGVGIRVSDQPRSGSSAP